MKKHSIESGDEATGAAGTGVTDGTAAAGSAGGFVSETKVAVVGK